MGKHEQTFRRSRSFFIIFYVSFISLAFADECKHGEAFRINYDSIVAAPVYDPFGTDRPQSGSNISSQNVALNIKLADSEKDHLFDFSFRHRKCVISFYIGGLELSTQPAETAFPPFGGRKTDRHNCFYI